MLIFYDHYKRPEKMPEKNSGEIKVEVAGYIPAEKQIANLMRAGVRLGQYRKEMYDTETDDAEIDPTRSPDFDLADASAYTRKLEQKKKQIEERQAAVKTAAEQAEKDSKKSPEKPEK